MATEQVPSTKPSFWMAAKYRLAVSGVMLSGLVGMASAAIDFSNISSLIQAVTGLIPDFLDLVVAIAPLLVTIAIIGFVLKFMDKILSWIGMR